MAEWDVFISYASEDKPFVQQLARGLEQKGLRVWIDETVLTLGDSLRETIDHGLAQSRYGVVVLSKSFFRKSWPQRELDGLTTKEMASGRKTILPIWHGITVEDVARFSLPLANKVAISTDRGLDIVIDNIERAVVGSAPNSPRKTSGSPLPTPPSIGQLPNGPTLQKALVELYSFDEMRDLVFRLGLDPEDISGANKSAYARELVSFMQRRGRLQEFVATLRADRPHWTG